MTERGKADKARAEQGRNNSGKHRLAVPDRASTAPEAAAGDTGFPGISFGTSGFIPPDVEIAAGPHHVVEAVNGRISTYNKNGTQAQTATPNAFFDGLGTIADDFIFDPQVEFNEYVGRFFVVYTTRNDAAARSFLLIGVSNTSDPTQGWRLLGLDAGFDGGTDTNNWCDYPHLGYSVQGTIITCNQFSHATSPSFQYAKVRVLLTSQLTAGGCCAWWDYWNLREGPFGFSPVFTVQPAAMHLAVSTDGAFLAAAEGGGGSGSNLHVYRVPNVPECCDGDSTGPGLDEAQRGVGGYSSPPDAEQPGGVQAIDTGDSRLQYAVFHWPRMYVGQNTAHGSDSTFAFTEFRVDQFPNALTLDNDWMWPANGMNRYYPAADSRPGSDKSQVYSFSSTSTNVGAGWIEVPSAVTCTSCASAEQTLRSGASTYLQLDGRNRNRWGDYFDASRDPNGTGIWIGGQYVDAQNSWGTEVGLTRQAIDTVAPTTSRTLSPAPNSRGWNSTNITVQLSAADGGPSGNVSGVRRITYAASGANPIPSTTVDGASATVPITANGVTTVTYFATDNWGNVEALRSVIVRKDSIAPTFSAGPHQFFRAGTTAASSTVPVRITWAASGGHSGICSYGPLYRRDTSTGTFTVQSGLPTSALATSAIQQLAAGFHQYRVRATDCAGNTAEVNGRGSTLRIVQEASSSIAYSTGWSQVSDSSAMGGALRQTTQASRTATFSASNLRSVAWGARLDAASGIATYRFDSGTPVNVNLQSSTTVARRLVAVTNAALGSHTVVITNQATSGHPKATLDFIAWLD